MRDDFLWLDKSRVFTKYRYTCICIHIYIYIYIEREI